MNAVSDALRRRGFDMLRRLLFVLGTTVSLAAHAQLTAPVKSGDTTFTETTVTVMGKREAKLKMSNWRMAETPHVVVFSQNDEEELRTTARNLEKLHFLLSVLLGRADAPDETIKIAVTMIGRAGEFQQLRLTDLRWQYGPFPERFEKTIYYDPRQEGSVLATTQDGVNLVLRPSVGRPTSRNCDGGEAGDGNPSAPDKVFVNPRVSSDGSESVDPNQLLMQWPVNELAFCQSAESRLYAAFAQNYLMTYFPAPYPRWFLQGFGELFATMRVGDDFVEYGHRPQGFTDVMEHYGHYPVTYVLDGRYLSGKGRHWTPYHAWRMVHLLYFSDEWKPRLHDYLDAIAQGVDPKSAASAFGNPAKLERAVTGYRGRKAPFERMNFSPAHAPEPHVRRMTRAEAGLIQGRLELGARVELPAEGSRDYSDALARRATWLERLRDNARQFPGLIEHQLLLAEAECRTGNPEECLAAAERALARSSTDTTALVWKGTALAQLAVRAPASERKRLLNEARSFIVKANRLDPEGILPLIAYYNTFAVAEEQAPEIAVEGLAKLVHASPAAPTSRLKLGEELIKRDLKDGARNALLPVAKGPFDTPEQPVAAALLP
jgi:tetratricopeptide (TPR) repeat protein